MAQYFNFQRLINKYKNTFEVITRVAGYYDDEGDWVDGEICKVTLEGAIIGVTERQILRSEGTLTEKDKMLFMLTPIDDKLHGAKVVFKGNIYDATTYVDHAEFTGVYPYTLKYISAFDDTPTGYDISADLERLEKRLDGETDD